MSISATTISENHRGIVFKFTGDGVNTGVTVTGQQGYTGATETANASVSDTPTSFFPKASGTGMNAPVGGTALTVNNVTVNGNVATVTLSAAPTNGHVCYGEVVFNQERRRL